MHEAKDHGDFILEPKTVADSSLELVNAELFLEIFIDLRASSSCFIGSLRLLRYLKLEETLVPVYSFL